MISWLRKKIQDKQAANKVLHNCSSQKIDPDILAALQEKEGMSAEEKACLAQCIQKHLNENKTPIENRKSFILMAVGGVAGIGLLASGQSNASICGSIRRRFERLLARRLKRPFENAVYGQFESALGVFDGITDLGSSMSTTSTIDATDSINYTIKEAAENRIKAASAPPPGPCEVDINAQKIMEAGATTEVNSVAYAIEMQSSMMPADEQERRRRMEKINADPSRASQSLDVNSILSLSDEVGDTHGFNLFGGQQGNQGALDFIGHAVGVSKLYSAAMSAHDRSFGSLGAQVASHQAQGEAATDLARRHIAATNLSKIKASREDDGELTVTAAEVRRRYGSDAEGWRKGIRSYADPNPLSIELCHQLALQAKIQVMLLEQQYTNTIQRGVTLMQYMDREGQS